MDNESTNCECNFNRRKDDRLPGPDGETNENDNSNAGYGIDDNDQEHSDAKDKDKNNDSKQDNGWGSGGEHGDGYRPGIGDGEGLSDDSSEGNGVPSANQMHVDEAVEILGITNHRDISEQDLNRIYRRRMLEVHPDHTQRTGLTQQQAVRMSQRLNDAVEEMRIHLNLPHGQNRFDPFVVDDNSNDEQD